MSKQIKIKPIIAIMFLASLFTSCASNGFTSAEKKTIHDGAPGVMKLVTTESRKDLRFLHRRSRELPENEIGTPDFGMLMQRMYATVTDPENEGVGIAAPQVGVSRRVILVQRFDKPEEPFMVYINPKIVGADPEMQIGQEGCLSVPGVSGDVERNRLVIVEHTDVDTLERVQETVEGFTAIIFQHEIDHLDGVLFTDRLTAKNEK